MALVCISHNLRSITRLDEQALSEFYTGSFIPITLEQLARERGVLLSDKETPCSAAVVSPDDDGEQCVVRFLGTEVNTASFAMYTFSLSVLFQALVIISISGAADHGRYRKILLLIFACIGAVATMSFLPVSPNILYVGALLAIIANTSFGASFVLLNSFLPLLVRYHPSIIYRKQPAIEAGGIRRESTDGSQDQGDPARLHAPQMMADAILNLQDSSHSSNIASSYDLPESSDVSDELTLSTRISALGLGIGYIAAGFLQLLSICVIVLVGSSLFTLKLVLFIIGCWWFIFSIPAALWLRPRPGPPLLLEMKRNRVYKWLGYLTYSWKSLGKTIIRAKRLRDVVLFLAAWFLVSDAIATVSGTAVLFAKTTLQMKPAALALINVIATLCGIMGAFGWRRASEKMNLNPSQTILACIVLLEMIPLYGLLGFVPFIKRWGVIGLQQPWELYPLGAIYGFCMGGLSSYCRSVFGELIPPGSEAAFYALYAITDKGSSIFGPAIVGAIADAYGEIRPVSFL